MNLNLSISKTIGANFSEGSCVRAKPKIPELALGFVLARGIAGVDRLFFFALGFGVEKRKGTPQKLKL